MDKQFSFFGFFKEGAKGLSSLSAVNFSNAEWLSIPTRIETNFMTEMLKMSTKKHKRSNPDKVFTGSYNCNCVYHSHPLFLSEPYCQKF